MSRIPHVVWISDQKEVPDGFTNIFESYQSIFPTGTIPDDLNKKIVLETGSTLQKLISPKFLLSTFDLYFEVLHNQKRIENEWKFQLSTLPGNYEQDLRKELKNYQQFTAYTGSKTPKQLKETHDEYKQLGSNLKR